MTAWQRVELKPRYFALFATLPLVVAGFAIWVAVSSPDYLWSALVLSVTAGLVAGFVGRFTRSAVLDATERLISWRSVAGRTHTRHLVSIEEVALSKEQLIVRFADGGRIRFLFAGQSLALIALASNLGASSDAVGAMEVPRSSDPYVVSSGIESA